MQVGTEFQAQTFQVTRADLVRYAGASGDFNPIHWSDRRATAVGLPGVIAHGMLTMALAGQAVAAWIGGAAPLVAFSPPLSPPVAGTRRPGGARIPVARG